MKSTIQDSIKDCRYCQLRKTDNTKDNVPVMNYWDPNNRLGESDAKPYPWNRVHGDATGPLPETPRGNKYIQLFKDSMTKFVVGAAVPDLQAETTAQVLLKLIHHYGAPTVLVTDQGKDYTSNIIKAVNQLNGIRKIKTTAHHPQSNGQVENQNRTLKDMLAAFCNRFQNDWDAYLDELIADYNATINDATGYTPHFLLFARESSRITPEYLLDLQDREDVVQTPFIQRRMEVMNWLWNHVAREMRSKTDKKHLKLLGDNTRPFVPYQPGDYFYWRRFPRAFVRDAEGLEHPLSAKLQLRWHGPYVVIKAFNPTLYECNVHGTLVRIHAINMKKC